MRDSLALFKLAVLLFRFGEAWLVEDDAQITKWSAGTEPCAQPYYDISTEPQDIDNDGVFCFMNPAADEEPYPVVHWFRSARSPAQSRDPVLAWTMTLNISSPNYPSLLPVCFTDGLCFCWNMDKMGLRNPDQGPCSDNQTPHEGILSCTFQTTSEFEFGYTGCGANLTNDGNKLPFFSPINAILRIGNFTQAPSAAPTGELATPHTSAAPTNVLGFPTLLGLLLLGLTQLLPS